MSTHEDLSVGYHQQDTNYYCGAACAQMVLSECGAGLLDQDTLYNDNHSHSVAEGGWATAPDGLQWTLNNRQSGRYFALDALSSEDATSRMIAWTIHHYQIAPVALVYGSQHWIVVRGYTASAAPASSADNTYSIDSFDVNNPWPPVPGFYNPANKPPPPHSATDNCGTGGTRGVADENISYSTWQSTYMTGVTWGHWNGKFVAVCDPDPPPAPPRVRQIPRLVGHQLLAAPAAIQHAQSALQSTGLAKRAKWSAVLGRTTPAEPVLVQRLDRRDEYYYVVPMGADAHHMQVVVSIDAMTGRYRQAALLGAPAPRLARIDPAVEVQKLAGHRVELDERRGFITLQPHGVSVHPTWVWKPCRESLSPYYPFQLITVGAHRLYKRSDGHIFTALHDTDHGI